VVCAVVRVRVRVRWLTARQSHQGKSRQVLNEDELVAGIRTWLKDNKRPEELLVFESEDWPDLDKLIHFFNQGAH
jgi:hypothetical protein